MGESASLQTAPVSVSTPGTVDVTLNIKRVAKNIYVNEPFEVDFSVVNNASRDLCLEIMWSNVDKTFKNTGSINPLGVVGKSVQRLGVIKPSSVTACSVVFVAFKKRATHTAGCFDQRYIYKQRLQRKIQQKSFCSLKIRFCKNDVSDKRVREI